MDLLIVSSEFFSLICLAETCVVLGLSYYVEEHIVPPWIMEEVHQIISSCLRLFRRAVGRERMEKNPLRRAAALRAFKAMEVKSCAGNFYRARNEISPLGVPREDQSTTLRDTTSVDEAAPKGTRRGSAATVRYNSTDAKRLIFYEKLFFSIDDEARGFITFEDAATFLGFAALDLLEEDRLDVLVRASSTQNTTQDETLVRWEWVEM